MYSTCGQKTLEVGIANIRGVSYCLSASMINQLCNDNFDGRPTTINLTCHCRRRMRRFARSAAVTSRLVRSNASGNVVPAASTKRKAIFAASVR